MAFRSGVLLVGTLLLLLAPARDGAAQGTATSPSRQAQEAARKADQADEAEAAARRREAATRRAARQAAETGDLDALDALDDADFDDPLDDPLDDLDSYDEFGIDDLGALDVTPSDADVGDDTTADPTLVEDEWSASLDHLDSEDESELDAIGDGSDVEQTDLYAEDERDEDSSLALDIYRSAARGLDASGTARPYDLRHDTPGFDVPITTLDDAGDLDGFGFDDD